MANVIATQINVIQKTMATALAKQESTYRDNASNDYKDAYKESINGYKVDDSIEFVKPAIYDAGDGKVDGTDIDDAAYDFAHVEEKVNVTVNSNPLLAPQFTDNELTFELDRNSKSGLMRLIEPVGEALNEKSEANGARLLTESADAVSYVTAAPTNFKDIFGEMKVNLIEAGAKGEIISIIDERMMIKLSHELEELFHPVKKVEDAFNGKFYSYNDIAFTKSVRVNTFTTAAGGDTLTLAADYIEGGTTIQLTAIGTVKVGDVIDLGVAQVNQRSKDVLVFNATRVVKAISGNIITITPIYFSGSSIQNVDAAGFAAADTMDVLGVDGVYKVYPVYAKKSWQYVNIEQPSLDALDEVKMKPIKGIRCRYYSWTEGAKATLRQRAETLELWFASRSEFMGTIRVKSGLI